MLLMFVTGVVSASGIWGSYKGNDIIRLTVNGKTIIVSKEDVPAISYDGRTMVPLYLLKYAGLGFSWDQATKTVNITTSSVPTPTAVQQPTQSTPIVVHKAYLYSNDGKVYLGKLTTNQFDKESIYNEFGDYGSKFSQTSIWNNLGKYGSDISNESAFNDIASKPPIVVEDGKFIGYLTTNTLKTPYFNPRDLYKILEDNGY